MRAVLLLSGRTGSRTARRILDWTVVTWHVKAMEERRQRLWMAKLAGRMRHLVTAAAFLGWSSNADRLRAQRAVLSRVKRRLESFAQESAWTSWAAAASRSRADRAATRLATRHCRRRRSARAIREWFANAEDQRQAATRGREALRRLRLRREAVAWDTWRDRAAHASAVSRAVSGGARRSGRTALRVAISAWVEARVAAALADEAAASRSRRAQQLGQVAALRAWRRRARGVARANLRRRRREVAVLTDAWEGLRTHQEARRRATAVAAEVNRRVPRAALAAALRAWVVAVIRRRRRRAAAAAVTTRHRAATSRRFMEAWAALAAERSRAARVMRRACGSDARRTLGSRLQDWKGFAADRRRRKQRVHGAARVIQQAALRREVAGWRATTVAARHAHRRGAEAASRVDRATEARVIRAWSNIAGARRARAAELAGRRAAGSEIRMGLTDLVKEADDVCKTWAVELRRLFAVMAEGEADRIRLRSDLAVSRAVFREREAAVVKSLTAAQLHAVRSTARRALAAAPPEDLERLAFPHLLHFERPDAVEAAPRSGIVVGSASRAIPEVSPSRLRRSAPVPRRATGGGGLDTATGFRDSLRNDFQVRSDPSPAPGPLDFESIPVSPSQRRFRPPPSGTALSTSPGLHLEFQTPVVSPSTGGLVEDAKAAVGFSVEADKHGLLRVSHVQSWSSLQQGDVLMAIDGFTMHGLTNDQISRARTLLAGGEKGSTVVLQIVRGSTTLKMPVVRGGHGSENRQLPSCSTGGSSMPFSKTVDRLAESSHNVVDGRASAQSDMSGALLADADSHQAMPDTTSALPVVDAPTPRERGRPAYTMAAAGASADRRMEVDNADSASETCGTAVGRPARAAQGSYAAYVASARRAERADPGQAWS